MLMHLCFCISGTDSLSFPTFAFAIKEFQNIIIITKKKDYILNLITSKYRSTLIIMKSIFLEEHSLACH